MQTEIGAIPEDWNVVTIGDIASFQGGSQPPIQHFAFQEQEGYIRLVQIRDYKTDKYLTYIPIALAKRFCAKDDIMIGRYGPPIFQILRGIEGSYNVALIKATPKDVDKEFLFYTLKAEPLFEYIDLLSRRSSGQTGVDLDGLREYKIGLPPISEQKSIADALSNMDNLISVIEKQIAKKKAIKQGAMQELLTGKKRLPGFSGEWQTFVFAELFDFIPNNAFTRAQMADSGKVKNIHYGDILTKYGAYVDGGSDSIPYIAKEIDLMRFAERCYLQSGDVIIADTAEDETVGKALEVINVHCPILAGQHTLLCRPKIRFADKFLGYYLNAACYHDQLLPYIVGTKVSSVSKASVAQTKLVVPEYVEQQAIAEILSNMDSEIEALEQKLAKYRQIKQGMMQQLLTGKIRLV